MVSVWLFTRKVTNEILYQKPLSKLQLENPIGRSKCVAANSRKFKAIRDNEVSAVLLKIQSSIFKSNPSTSVIKVHCSPFCYLRANRWHVSVVSGTKAVPSRRVPAKASEEHQQSSTN